MLLKEKNEIIDWLDKYGIEKYTLIPDDSYGYVVDVAIGVHLSKAGIETIPIKFRYVSGGFYCNDNHLTSLEGCPETVGGYFACFSNQLTSLKGLPQSIGGKILMTNNPRLEELENITDFELLKKIITKKELSEKLADELKIQDCVRKIKI